jgi:hypothetical protein
VVVLGYGSVQWGANQPNEADPSPPAPPPSARPKNPFDQILETTAANNATLQAVMGQKLENIGRAEARNTASKVMIAGAVVLFIGVAVSASAKKKPEGDSAATKL